MNLIRFGSVPYKGKKHRKSIWKQLRQELGDSARLWIEDNMVMYRYKEMQK